MYQLEGEQNASLKTNFHLEGITYKVFLYVAASVSYDLHAASYLNSPSIGSESWWLQ